LGVAEIVRIPGTIGVRMKRRIDFVVVGKKWTKIPTEKIEV